MDSGQGRFVSDNGTHIFYRCWVPVRPQAVILFAHGLAEHSGRYEGFARVFGAAGYATYAPDQPGHGLSAGQQGHIEQFADYTDAMAGMLGIAREKHPEIPFVLFGHSMGGLIAARFLLEQQSEFVAAVLTGAAIRAPEQPSAAALFFLRLIAMIAPRVGVRRLSASGVSRDPLVVHAYEHDPLVYRGKGTARLAANLFSTMQYVLEHAGSIRLPILLMHGSADRLTAVEGSQLLHDAVSSDERELVIYDGLYHEILNEPEREQVMTDIQAWLALRLDAEEPGDKEGSTDSVVEAVSAGVKEAD